VVRVEVVSKDVGVGKNGAKARIAQEYSLARPRAKLQSRHLWVRGSCWEKRIKFKLIDKVWACKKNSSCKFSRLLAGKCLSRIHVSWCPIASPQRSKQDTVGVVGGASAKLPHCTSLALDYLMENEMPFVNHIVKWWGCSYTIENDKGLNGRTQGHPILKPMSKLM
jgi:hypothetical protein